MLSCVNNSTLKGEENVRCQAVKCVRCSSSEEHVLKQQTVTNVLANLNVTGQIIAGIV
jgi:hypothetical protein